MKRACCHCIFAAKATLAFLAAAFSLGIQIYWVYNRIDLTKLRLPPVVINQKLCAFTSTTLSRIEPQNGKFLMGFSPQWEVDRPKAINDRLNRKAVLFNAFVKITDTDFMKDMITWHAQMVGEVGAILELTVDPGVPIQTIPDSMYLALATHIRFCNQQYGTPMILRFAHEMNVLGGWMVNYGNQPNEYRRAFATLSTYVHTLTNLTAMLWSPNMGGGYPYGYPQSNPAFPRANDVDPVKRADFERMDTNNDRVISNLDDPYLPYYPGDQYVDWVGISLYNTRESGGQTYPSQATSITAILDGAGPDSFNNFYDRFSKVARKPFCLSETGAAWQSNLQGTTVTVGEQTEESIKLDWWNRVMAVIGNPKYPNFKGAVWFEESKSENAFTNPAVFVNKNYRVTFSPTIAAQINAAWDLKTGIIVEAGAVKVTCSGEIVV